MKKESVLLAAFVFTLLFGINVKAADITSAILQNTLNAGQTNVQNVITNAPAALTNEQIAVINALNEQQAMQQQALADAIALQQKAALEAAAAQQKAAMDAAALMQKAAQEALAAQMAAAEQAQKSALEACLAIQEASLACPQLDTICDTNCAEQNALLYAKSIPDFVLVDISEQRVVFYKNGLRVLSDNCVTGDARKGLNTSVGIHKIIFKDTDRTLKGSYGTAFVKYWMRFTSGGQGLHDAGWRSSFANTTYISNGSHGCVNLKRPTARTIFENSYVGMFVIVEN